MGKILVVVDYQNDFVTGALGFEGADRLDKGIANKIRKYGKGNVVYTLDTHSENYENTREGKVLPIKHCVKGTQGHRLYGETNVAMAEVEGVCIEKETFGISPETIIDLKNKYKDLDSIEIVGLVTNMCVVSNVAVFQAAYPETQIIVDASLCDSFNKELHYKTLEVIEGLQVEVINK